MEYNQTEHSETNSANLLNEEELLVDEFIYASTGQRFLNFIIDNLLMNYGLSYITGYAVGLLIGLTQTTYFNDLLENRTKLFLFGYLLAIFNYLIYYITCEKLFNGYTLGKIITGSKAIRDDGKPLTFKDATLRSLCRLAPFEILSGFKIRPWHDEWTNTMVVKAR